MQVSSLAEGAALSTVVPSTPCFSALQSMASEVLMETTHGSFMKSPLSDALFLTALYLASFEAGQFKSVKIGLFVAEE